jgi:hypothetical protein
MSYASDVPAAHWEQIEHYFEPRDRRGSGHKHPKKQIVEGILYVVRTLTAFPSSINKLGTLPVFLLHRECRYGASE